MKTVNTTKDNLIKMVQEINVVLFLGIHNEIKGRGDDLPRMILEQDFSGQCSVLIHDVSNKILSVEIRDLENEDVYLIIFTDSKDTIMRIVDGWSDKIKINIELDTSLNTNYIEHCKKFFDSLEADNIKVIDAPDGLKVILKFDDEISEHGVDPSVRRAAYRTIDMIADIVAREQLVRLIKDPTIPIDKPITISNGGNPGVMIERGAVKYPLGKRSTLTINTSVPEQEILNGNLLKAVQSLANRFKECDAESAICYNVSATHIRIDVMLAPFLKTVSEIAY